MNIVIGIALAFASYLAVDLLAAASRRTFHRKSHSLVIFEFMPSLKFAGRMSWRDMLYFGALLVVPIAPILGILVYRDYPAWAIGLVCGAFGRFIVGLAVYGVRQTSGHSRYVV